MANEEGKDGAGGSQPQYVPKEDFDKLTEQVENLNKGIAGYRDTASKAEQRAAAAEKRATELEKKIEFESEDDKELDLAPEDEKKLKVWAEKKGFVTEEQLQAERVRLAGENAKSIEAQAVESFLSSHKDVDDDAKWAEIQKEFRAWYRQPSSLAEYKQVLNKIYKDLFGAAEDGASKARAEMQAKKRLSLGGGSQRSNSSGEESLEDLQSRYPNLSREQIEDKLSEIDSLYKK